MVPIYISDAAPEASFTHLRIPDPARSSALYFFALFRQKSHNKPPPASANAPAPSEHPRAAAARDAARPPTVCRRWGSPKQK